MGAYGVGMGQIEALDSSWNCSPEGTALFYESQGAIYGAFADPLYIPRAQVFRSSKNGSWQAAKRVVRGGAVDVQLDKSVTGELG